MSLPASWNNPSESLPPIDILLQPKQVALHDLCWYDSAPWLGIGGGRGGSKSAGLYRLMLNRRLNLPGTIGAIVMRNYDQVKRYHIDPMLRYFPQLEDYYHKTDAMISLPMGKDSNGNKIPDSEIHFTYAESLDDVIRRFRSANYFDLFVDQAEQFEEVELREMKQACRWPEDQQFEMEHEGPKFILAFNMGGLGIDFLRKKFHFQEFNEFETAADFAFIHVYPWDNVTWVAAALKADGLTETDYYEKFTEEQRIKYCATRSKYGKALFSQDEALRQRDFYGEWRTLEGAYFARAWDHKSAVLTEDKIQALIKPWWPRWLAQDYGYGHYNVTYWNARGTILVKDAHEILGWTNVTKPIKAVITYREYVAGGAGAPDEGGDRELAETDIAKEIIKRTDSDDDSDERKMLKCFWLSPDAFELSVRRAGQGQIAKIMGDVLHPAGFPRPAKADNRRKGGWKLMYNLMLSTKRHAADDYQDGVWLISVHCPELISAIPLAMRNPKDLDDVLKTDTDAAKIDQDALDGGRYSLMSMLRPGKVPDDEVLREKLERIPEENKTARLIATLKHQDEVRKRHQPVTRLKPDWRRMLEG